jgi:hypothetical protein
MDLDEKRRRKWVSEQSEGKREREGEEEREVLGTGRCGKRQETESSERLKARMGHSSGVPEVPERKRKSVEFFSLPTRSQFWGSASGNLVRDHELNHRFDKSEI